MLFLSYGKNSLNMNCGSGVKYSFEIHRKGVIKAIGVTNPTFASPSFVSGILGPYYYYMNQGSQGVHITISVSARAFVTRSANLGASTTKEISPGSPDTFTQDLNFKDIGASSYITIRVCAIEIEGCYILIVTKKLEEFKFDSQNLRVFNSIGEDLSLLSLPAASHFTYSFNGTTGDADYIKFSGFGQKTLKT